MRISSIQVANFCCLQDLTMSFDDVTVLVGANSTGKSSLLYALSWFFEGGPLTEEHISGHQPDAQVSIGVTFTDFDEADREALGSYVQDEEATFWRTWSADDGVKLTGKGRAYPPFAKIREHDNATPKRQAYNELRESRSDLDLPRVSSASAVDEALVAWEADHPDQLEDGRTDATHLFGFTGQARLAQRMDFVLVRAVVDPDEEITDSRGTLLRQLLDRSLGEQSVMRERLAELEQRISNQMGEIMQVEGGATLDRLSGEVTAKLAELVPGSEVQLSARSPSVKVPSLAVDLRVADGDLSTAVARQGHGFQRALLISVVQLLAATTGAESSEEHAAQAQHKVATPPALMLTLEEPELYQHPLQARHFSATLSTVAAASRGRVQVCYATHSEHFVDPSHYERLRRFRRRPRAPWPTSEVAQATVDRVTARLADVVEPDQIPQRIRLTLRRQVAEAIFAKAVVLVEGHSDAGLLHGLADRDGGFDAMGVAVVNGHGKTQLLIPWAVLSDLGVPSFVVFDGDIGIGQRMHASGKDAAKVEAAERQTRRENEQILETLGAEGIEQPATAEHANHAVFECSLEAELTAWLGFRDAVEAWTQDESAFRKKPDDAARHAAATRPQEPPTVFAELIDRVKVLAS